MGPSPEDRDYYQECIDNTRAGTPPVGYPDAVELLFNLERNRQGHAAAVVRWLMAQSA